MTFQKSQLTRYALKRVATAHAGERMVFTGMGLGDKALTGNLNEATELTGEKQRFPISGSNVSDNNFWASCKPANANDPEGIYVRAIGLYIADPDHPNDRGRDHLYAVTSIIPDFGGEPDYLVHIPQSPGNLDTNCEIRLNTIISSTALIEIIGGIGSFGIATTAELGLVRSSNNLYSIFVEPGTGEMKVNNIEELVERFGEAQGRIPGEYRSFAIDLSEWELAKNRLLRLVYQIIKISDYQELCDRTYVGDATNASANFWYKCSSGGDRSTSGQYMRVADWRGMFMRGAGANAVFKAANDAPYDGNAIGSFNKDTIGKHSHETYGNNYLSWNPVLDIGLQYTTNTYYQVGTAYRTKDEGGIETAPAWLAVQHLITY